jgi:gas vesicle protein
MKLSSLIAGIGVGVAAAIILAPRSGEETREMIINRAAKGRRYADHRLQDLRDRANEVVEQGKEAVGRQKKAVAAAAQAAKDTYTRESQTKVSERGGPVSAIGETMNHNNDPERSRS